VIVPRHGPMYGPDVTFLGVDRCTIDEADLKIAVSGTQAAPMRFMYRIRRSGYRRERRAGIRSLSSWVGQPSTTGCGELG
jgi:hypothetical protein